MFAQILIVVLILLILGGMGAGGYYWWYIHNKKPECEKGEKLDADTGKCVSICQAGFTFNPNTEKCESPSNPLQPPPKSPALNWSSVKTRPSGDSDVQWSDKIWSVILNNRQAGTQEGLNQGGVTSAATKYLKGKNALDQALATELCIYPCQRYKPDGKGWTLNTNVCQCPPQPLKAVNF